MKTTGVYIHIPFCKSKCSYCDFYSITSSDLVSKYIESLCYEISINPNFNIDTIYFGGGTPSYIDAKYIDMIVNSIYKYNRVDLKEFTIECNVDDITDDLLKSYLEIGVNRLSLGVQSLNDKVLLEINRRHDSKTALFAIEKSLKYFDNVSCDLIMGLPFDSFDAYKMTLNQLADFNLKHYSIYGLSIEESTSIYKKSLEIKDYLPKDDYQAKVYQYTNDFLKSNNINRYEISNFAKDNFESKHNLKYWQMQDYIGFGTNAHSLVGDTRFYNKPDLENYINNIKSDYNKIRQTEEVLNKDDKMYETTILAFRLKEGIDLQNFFDKFSVDFREKYEKAVKKNEKYLNISNSHISIKDEYTFVMNSILLDFQ